MPHVIVKLHAGRTEAEKKTLAAGIAQVIKDTLGAEDGAISVGVEDVKPRDWMKDVYQPDIEQKQSTLYKLPGY